MKKIVFIAWLLTIGIAGISGTSAQIRANVSINIGNQPIWGPVGYDNAQYYYFPDIDAYYNIPNRQFIYLNNNRWVFGASLPSRYNYDLYRGYKVVINDPQPYLHPDIYRSRYGKYKGWYGRQPVIRDSRDQRYYQIKDHPMHANWNQGNNRNQGFAHNRGNGNGKWNSGGGNHGNGGGHGNGNGHGNEGNHGNGNGHGNGHGHR